jgi:hypothetical protein
VNSAVWRVEDSDGRTFFAKQAPASELLPGVEVAAYLASVDFRSGRPVAIHVEDGQALALLEAVQGVPLAATDGRPIGMTLR